MASKSETGHARNVANFKKLISQIETFGPKYAPSNPALSLPALRNLYDQSVDALDALKNQEAAYKKSVGERLDCYTPLKPLATRVLNALVSTEAPQKVKEDCKGVIRKIRGARASGNKSKSSSAAAAEGAPNEKSISISRQSFDLLAEHFAELIAFLESEPAYRPNEPELQIATLKTCYADMLAANNVTTGADGSLSNARILRDKMLYGDKTGLTDIASAAKAYVKSVYGAAGAEYKKIGSIEFSKIK